MHTNLHQFEVVYLSVEWLKPVLLNSCGWKVVVSNHPSVHFLLCASCVVFTSQQFDMRSLMVEGRSFASLCDDRLQ